MPDDGAAIGSLNETELHEQLKYRYAPETGSVEQSIDGFVVDVVTESGIVEVQTSAFAKLRRKIEHFAPLGEVVVVHPIAVETVITKLTAAGELISSRRSPKRGRFEDAFREIVAIADLLPHPSVSIHVVLVRAIETRIDDGKGSWRRKGVSIAARQLGDVVRIVTLSSRSDYLSALPVGLSEEFTNSDLMAIGSLRYAQAQPVTRALCKMGLLVTRGKRGRERIYVRSTTSRE